MAAWAEVPESNAAAMTVKLELRKCARVVFM